MKNLEKLEAAYGETQTLITPSGHQITIREQTGEDDDILSNAKWVEDGSSTNKFISSVVVQTDITENGKMTQDVARNLKLCDKYFIMIASRIFSIGQSLKFVYEWPDKPPLEVDYEEDLGLYIWDYGNKELPFPKEGHEEYFRFRIPPHPHGKDTHRELKLDSKKTIRYKFMDGHSEKWEMDLTNDRQSINASLLSRGIELQLTKDNWVKIQNFKQFTPREMMQIRKDVEDHDPITLLITTLEHPHTGEIVDYPVVASSDFFFPREV